MDDRSMFKKQNTQDLVSFIEELSKTQREIHEIHDRLRKIDNDMGEVKCLEKQMNILKTNVEDVQKGIQGLLDAWTTANSLLRFIKWVGGTAIILFATWDYIKAMFKL